MFIIIVSLLPSIQDGAESKNTRVHSDNALCLHIMDILDIMNPWPYRVDKCVATS